MPLLIATGAAELSRGAVGTAVFGGMIAASSIGIFMVPMLYVTFQLLRERLKARSELGPNDRTRASMNGSKPRQKIGSWLIALPAVAVAAVVTCLAEAWTRQSPAGIASSHGRIEAVKSDIAGKTPRRIRPHAV